MSEGERVAVDVRREKECFSELLWRPRRATAIGSLTQLYLQDGLLQVDGNRPMCSYGQLSFFERRKLL